MLKSIKLYGELAEKYGKDWSLDISSAGEAFQALAANNQGFRQFVSSSEQRGVGYKVVVGKDYIEDYSELANPSGKQEIKIIPVVLGAKNKGLGMVLVGALIFFAAPYLLGQYATSAMGAELTIAQTWEAGFNTITSYSTGSMAMKFAGAMILGGIASMLAPTPQTPEVKDQPTNYGFDGAENTARQGFSIPVCYGQLMVGGAVISSGIQPEDYTP